MFSLIKKDKNIGEVVKQNVLKNKTALLDILAGSMQGARQCPYMMAAKCIGPACELFMQFGTTGDDGESVEFHRCAHVQMPLLVIELNNNIIALTQKLEGENVKANF